MKIGEGVAVTKAASATAPVPVPYRTGDVVVVQASKVVEMTETHTRLVLKFPNGELLSTDIGNKFSGREGDLFSIRINRIENFRVYAELTAAQPGISKPANHILDILTGMGMDHSQENYQMVVHMLGQNITVKKETLKQMLQYRQAYPELSLEQVAFLVKHQIPATPQNISALVSIFGHENLIGQAMFGFIQSMYSEERKSKQLKFLLDQFYFSPDREDLTAEALRTSKTIQNLQDILNFLKEDKFAAPQLAVSAELFMKEPLAQFEIARYIYPFFVFLQIPVAINGNYTTVEAYIQKRTQAQEQPFHTALLRIPTQNMGMVEAFIIMKERNCVFCHFKAEDCRPIRASVVKLYDMLSLLGIRLAKVTYNQIPWEVTPHNFEACAEMLSRERKFDERV